MRIVAAAVLYFAIVFAIGFLLGPIRVLWLEPKVGPIIAVTCEAPLLLAAMVAAARWIPRMVGLPRHRLSLLMVGVGALLLQQVADFAVGLGLRGIGPSELLAQFTTPQGLIYAALLVAFVTMPLLLSCASCPRAAPRARLLVFAYDGDDRSRDQSGLERRRGVTRLEAGEVGQGEPQRQ